MHIGSLNDAFRIMTKQLTTPGQLLDGGDAFARELSGKADSQQDEQAAARKPLISPATSAAVMLLSEPVSQPKIPNYLMTVEEYNLRREDGRLNFERPSVDQFMNRTGVDVSTASRMIYGVVGASPDLRDWLAIMASDDPLAAARSATGQMLKPSEQLNYVNANLEDQGYRPLSSDRVIARTENYALIDYGTTPSGLAIRALNITDSDGQFGVVLSWDADEIADMSRAYDLDMNQLGDLADQLDQLGIGYRPYQLQAGTSMGINLLSLVPKNNLVD